jgi:hypothetical protein
LGLILLAGGWMGYQQRVVNVPLVKGNPPFSLTPKQTELVAHLRAAHAEVERYRMAHGQLPARIELKSPRVHLYLRPMKQGYMLMAVSENQNLVLMNDGRWHKAR